MVQSRCRLGTLAVAREEYDRASEWFRQCLALVRRYRYRTTTVAADVLDGVAGLAAARGRPEGAAQLYGAAAAVRETTGPALPPPERPDHERRLAAVRTAAGDAAFTSAWEEGRALSLAEAVDLALDLNPSPSP
jgi:hypothetical protein